MLGERSSGFLVVFFSMFFGKREESTDSYTTVLAEAAAKSKAGAAPQKEEWSLAPALAKKQPNSRLVLPFSMILKVFLRMGRFRPHPAWAQGQHWALASCNGGHRKSQRSRPSEIYGHPRKLGMVCVCVCVFCFWFFGFRWRMMGLLSFP